MLINDALIESWPCVKISITNGSYPSRLDRGETCAVEISDQVSLCLSFSDDDIELVILFCDIDRAVVLFNLLFDDVVELLHRDCFDVG